MVPCCFVYFHVHVSPKGPHAIVQIATFVSAIVCFSLFPIQVWKACVNSFAQCTLFREIRGGNLSVDHRGLIVMQSLGWRTSTSCTATWRLTGSEVKEKSCVSVED